MDIVLAAVTPSASLEMTITNEALIGQLKLGQSYLVDFTPVD